MTRLSGEEKVLYPATTWPSAETAVACEAWPPGVMPTKLKEGVWAEAIAPKTKQDANPRTCIGRSGQQKQVVRVMVMYCATGFSDCNLNVPTLAPRIRGSLTRMMVEAPRVS